MKLNVGVIGCGNIARFHFDGLEQAGARIAWVCDVDAERARAVASRFNARCTQSYQDMLQDPEVDVVDIAAPSSLHLEAGLAAIEAGKAVICEKTLATNAEDALALVQRARDKGVILYTSYMKRFIPAVERLKELLPRIGQPMSASIRSYQQWGDLWSVTPQEGFFHTPPGGVSELVNRYGGGVLVCGGSHLLDLVNFVFGRPKRIYAQMHIPEGRDYDLTATAILDTPECPVHFEAVAHPLKHIGFLRDGWDERLEVSGTKGRLEFFSAAWDQFEHKASMLAHYDNETGASTEHRFAPCSPFARALAFFCENIARGEQGAQPATTGYDVDECIAAITRSAREGQAVDVTYRIEP